jgi:Na+/melibiose symporter-like transporter
MTSTPIPADAVAAPAARSSARSSALPAVSRWYRREPWLVPVLAAYAVILVAFFTPEALHVPLTVTGGLLLVAAFALLLRQGPFRPWPGA